MIASFMFQVFPRNSPYFPDISQAVLEISGKGKLLQPENSIKSTYKCSVLGDDEKTDSLGLNSFGGLILVTLGTSTIALVYLHCPLYVYQNPLYFYQNHLCL